MAELGCEWSSVCVNFYVISQWDYCGHRSKNKEENTSHLIDKLDLSILNRLYFFARNAIKLTTTFQMSEYTVHRFASVVNIVSEQKQTKA